MPEHRLCVNQFALDGFLGAVGDVVHGLDPLPLRLAFQILGYALGLHHLADDAPVAVLGLLVEVGKVGVQLACQNQVVQQKLRIQAGGRNTSNGKYHL